MRLFYLSISDDVLIPFDYEFIKISDEEIGKNLNQIKSKKLNDTLILIDSRCLKTIFYSACYFKDILIYNTQNNRLETFLHFINHYYFDNSTYNITNYEICLNCLFLEIFCKFFIKHLQIQFNIRDFLNLYDEEKVQRNFKKSDYIPQHYINLVLVKKYILLKKSRLFISKNDNVIDFKAAFNFNIKRNIIEPLSDLSFNSLIHSLDYEIMNFKYLSIGK